MGEVVDFATSEEIDQFDAFVTDLLEKVFDNCTNSLLEPEMVCWLMVTTFANSMFHGLCKEHAAEEFAKCITAVMINNDVSFEEMVKNLSKV